MDVFEITDHLFNFLKESSTPVLLLNSAKDLKEHLTKYYI